MRVVSEKDHEEKKDLCFSVTGENQKKERKREKGI